MRSPIVPGQHGRTLPYPLGCTNAQQATAQEPVFIEFRGATLSADNRNPIMGIALVSGLQSGIRAQRALLPVFYASWGSALGIVQTSIVPIMNLGIGDPDILQASGFTHGLTVKQLIGHPFAIGMHGKSYGLD